MPSQDFQAFQCSCFDTSFGQRREGLNVPALLRLKRSERKQAEALVLRALPTSLDARPIQAVGHLKLQSAGPLLRQRLAHTRDPAQSAIRVHLAWALFQIEHDPAVVSVIAEVLHQTPRETQWSRMMAVEALSDFGEVPQAVNALLDAVVDADNFVAFLAMKALKQVYHASEPILCLLDDLTQPRSDQEGPRDAARICETLMLIRGLAGLNA